MPKAKIEIVVPIALCFLGTIGVIWSGYLFMLLGEGNEAWLLIAIALALALGSLVVLAILTWAMSTWAQENADKRSRFFEEKENLEHCFLLLQGELAEVMHRIRSDQRTRKKSSTAYLVDEWLQEVFRRLYNGPPDIPDDIRASLVKDLRELADSEEVTIHGASQLHSFANELEKQVKFCGD